MLSIAEQNENSSLLTGYSKINGKNTRCVFRPDFKSQHHHMLALWP